jgi:hypothetical protein
MRRKTEAERLPTKDWPTGDLSLLRRNTFRSHLADEHFSVLVCAELSYTNSQIWFIRFDVDQLSKLVCVGNQAGEVFVWMLSGTEFVQVVFCDGETLLIGQCQGADARGRLAVAAAKNTPRACGRLLWERQV